jgi:hypothetical protein
VRAMYLVNSRIDTLVEVGIIAAAVAAFLFG